MIATVTFNPSLDYIVSVPSFRTGTLNRTTDEAVYPGGKGINVSIILHHLGVETKAYGFLGGYLGSVLEKMLEDYGIENDFITVPDGMTRINVKLKSEKETEINGRGPLIGEKELQALYVRLSKLHEGDTLVLSGSIPAGMKPTTYADIMQLLEKNEIKIVVDATGDLLTHSLSHHPFLIKPNRDELGDIFSREITTDEQVRHYAKTLQKYGASNVLVSLGKDGALLVDEDGMCHERKAPQGTVVNSVGAGDSMVAGFLAGFMTTGQYDKALDMGIAAGSASAFSGKLATKQEIVEVLEKLR
jgi:1-phosphofructokinase